jgi:cytochrome c-type biogenesis protein CcmH
MRRMAFWAGLAAIVAFTLVGAARPQEPTTDADRVAAIAAELRCPVCQGLSVADSDSETARNIRTDIARRVSEGQSPDQVRQAYVARYGEWVLLRPERDGVTGLVWFLPPLAAAAATAGLVVALWRWRHQRRFTPSRADVDLVAQTLEHRRN